jgi:ABC-type amino acid transport substrate-binding protein
MVLVGRSGSAARGLEDLQGHSIAVRAGSMASLAVGAWRGGALASSIKGYNLREDVLSAVEAGEAEYAFVDIALWDRYRSQHQATALVQSGFEHPVKMNIGLLAKASDADALDQVSAAVTQELAAPQISLLSRQEQATWILPVAPVVRPSLTISDFASPGS